MNQVRELLEFQLHRSAVVSAWLGYGEPLFLEFTKSSRRECGDSSADSSECKFETNFATWSVEGPICGNSKGDNRDCLESACQSLVGAIVDDLELSADAVLTIRFEKDLVLRIIPWPVTDGHSDAWSLTLPDDTILAVSNSGQVAIVEQHTPIKDWFADKS